MIPLALLLSACGSFGRADLSVPLQSTAVGEYTLQRGDRLRIRVWPDSSLGGDFPVEEDGRAYLPVIGSLPVAGLPLSELRQELRSRYGEAMKEPTVSVTPLFRVSVLGAVQRPGLYEVDPTQTIIHAISIAGGFRPDARENRVRIFRDGQVLELDAREGALAGGGEVWDLRSGDRIVVPQGWNLGARDILYVLQSAVLILTLYRQTRSDRGGG